MSYEQTQRRKASAVITSAQLAKTRSAFERFTALGVLVLSVLGTVTVFAGGWAAVLAGKGTITALAWGVAAQLLLTLLQWFYGRVSRLHPVYLASLGIDAGLTTLGYGGLIAPPLALALAPKVPEPLFVAWALLALLALLVAWYPESRLVD